MLDNVEPSKSSGGPSDTNRCRIRELEKEQTFFFVRPLYDPSPPPPFLMSSSNRLCVQYLCFWLSGVSLFLTPQSPNSHGHLDTSLMVGGRAEGGERSGIFPYSVQVSA